jgi:hypothetical protein
LFPIEPTLLRTNTAEDTMTSKSEVSFPVADNCEVGEDKRVYRS